MLPILGYWFGLPARPTKPLGLSSKVLFPFMIKKLVNYELGRELLNFRSPLSEFRSVRMKNEGLLNHSLGCATHSIILLEDILETI